MQTTDRNIYGTIEKNGLVNGVAYHDAHNENHAGTVYWNDPDLLKITRLRLLSDPGFPFWDVSYVHGVLKNGQNVEVELPFSQLPKRGMWKEIYAAGTADRVYVKRILDASAISTLN